MINPRRKDVPVTQSLSAPARPLPRRDRCVLLVALILAVSAFGALAGSASASTLVDPSVNSTLGSLPTTPACDANTGGDVDEEICLYVTNALTAWHKTSTGPKVSGAGTKLYYTSSSDIAGGWHEGYGVYWAGPFCPAATWTNWNVDGGNSTTQAGPTSGAGSCIGVSNGFTFGQRRQVQFWDNDSTANSGEWKLFAQIGSITAGQGVFRVGNNDGGSFGDVPYCDAHNNRLSQWVSCGAVGVTSYQGVFNTAHANDGIGASRVSGGFYVQDYPVAIKIINNLPDSVFIANPPGTPEHAKQDTNASTFLGEARATTGHTLWWVGYRMRLGHRNGASQVLHARIPLTGTLESTQIGVLREQWHGATVTIKTDLTLAKNPDGTLVEGVTAKDSTCTIGDTTAAGAQAKCEVLSATHGSPSHPAEVHVRIYN